MNPYSFTDYKINKLNLINNVKIIRSCLNKGVEFYAVVKANAYGVGSVIVSKILEPFVDGFAVANIWEGVELRRSGISVPIICLGAINLDATRVYAEYKIKPTINNKNEMIKLSRDCKTPIFIEIGLNSGMNRFGLSSKCEILELKSEILKYNNIQLDGVYSHLATKEDDVDFIYYQKTQFDKLKMLFNDVNPKFHISNTNAILHHNDLNYDRVRCGFGIYGMMDNEIGLKPVIEIESKIVNIIKIEKGESIGYDRTFFAERDMKIGVVPLGYYDGIKRGLSNKGKFLVDKKFVNIVGRVCMDVCMVDLTNIDNAHYGSRVVVLGEDGDKSITLEDYAKLLNTSPYEVLTSFNNTRMNVIVD